MPAKEEHFDVERVPGLQAASIRRSANEAWLQMRTPGSRANANALSHGIDPTKLPDDLGDVLEIRPDGAGVVTTGIVVSGLLGKIAWDVWKFVLLPHIREMWGDTALKKRNAGAALPRRSKPTAAKRTVTRKSKKKAGKRL
jgi:hypothetical protein